MEIRKNINLLNFKLTMLIGIVGKPNVGKSTFFKALTLADVLIADYPFATIKPNQGVGYVKIPCPDKEFGVRTPNSLSGQGIFT